MIKRGLKHDLSKFGPDEFNAFSKTAYKLRYIKYGTPEYKELQKEVDNYAKLHHWENNSHHPNYYKLGIKEMTLLDQLEMLVDWRAATYYNPEGDMFNSFKLNKERFKYDNLTDQIYRKDSKEIGLI